MPNPAYKDFDRDDIRPVMDRHRTTADWSVKITGKRLAEATGLSTASVSIRLREKSWTADEVITACRTIGCAPVPVMLDLGLITAEEIGAGAAYANTGGYEADFPHRITRAKELLKEALTALNTEA